MSTAFVGSLLLLTTDEVLARKILNSYVGRPQLKISTSSDVLRYLNIYNDADTVFADVRSFDESLLPREFERRIREILPKINVIFILTNTEQEDQLHRDAHYKII
jgi:two-component SAPR family response regulator